ALANVPSLPRARERKSNDAVDLFRDTSSNSWIGPDLFWGSKDVVVAARFPAIAGGFRKLFLQRKADDRPAGRKTLRQAHTRLWRSWVFHRQLVPAPCNWASRKFPSCACRCS